LVKPAQLHREQPLWAENEEADIENPEGETVSRAQPPGKEEARPTEAPDASEAAEDISSAP